MITYVKQFTILVLLPVFSSVLYRFYPMIDHQEDFPEGSFMAKIWRYWSDQEAEVMDLELVPKTEYQLPTWLDGDFILAGPSKFGMGKRKLEHVLDGFGRFNRFKIENNSIKFNSKMLNSKWLTLSQLEQDIPSGFLFSETNPGRWLSKIPFVNLFYSKKYFDNNWVMPTRMPDGQTYVGMTDMPQMLELDIEKLEQKGFVEFDDKLQCMMGTTHVKNLPNGDMVGVCSEVTNTGKKFLTAYRIRGSNIHMRELIGRVPTNGINYQHSFGLSEDYVAIFEHPINVNMFNEMILGYDMLRSMIRDGTDTTKIHLMSTKDGSFKTHDSRIYFQMIHTGNSFVKDGKFICDATIYQDSTHDVYEVFEFKNLKQGVQKINYGSSWKRFEIDLASGELSHKDLSVLEWGNYELPTFNPTYDGLKENCYTYIMEMFANQVMDENYSWDMVKYDACQEKVVGRFSSPGYLPNEGHFIPNPEGLNEDDGVLLTIAYDFQNDISKLIILNPVEMTILQEYELPFRLPWTFHSGFWRD